MAIDNVRSLVATIRSCTEANRMILDTGAENTPVELNAQRLCSKHDLCQCSELLYTSRAFWHTVDRKCTMSSSQYMGLNDRLN
jgi:hypothetical protein